LPPDNGELTDELDPEQRLANVTLGSPCAVRTPGAWFAVELSYSRLRALALEIAASVRSPFPYRRSHEPYPLGNQTCFGLVLERLPPAGAISFCRPSGRASRLDYDSSTANQD
jgi:hypothetical protein